MTRRVLDIYDFMNSKVSRLPVPSSDCKYQVKDFGLAVVNMTCCSSWLSMAPADKPLAVCSAHADPDALHEQLQRCLPSNSSACRPSMAFISRHSEIEIQQSWG